jgi:hypothetical protein
VRSGHQSQLGDRSLVIADDPEFQTRNAAFLQRLGELGWSVGRNLRIDYRWGAGESERYRASKLTVLARLIASEMISSSTIVLVCVAVFLFRIGPYLVCPSKSRSAIDQAFGKAILPSLLAPLLRLSAPVAR